MGHVVRPLQARINTVLITPSHHMCVVYQCDVVGVLDIREDVPLSASQRGTEEGAHQYFRTTGPSVSAPWTTLARHSPPVLVLFCSVLSLVLSSTSPSFLLL